MNDTTPKPSGLALHWQILIAMIVGAGIGVLMNTGDIDVGQPVTATITTSESGVKLVEFIGDQLAFEQTFADVEAFGRSYPGMRPLLGDEPGSQSVDVGVTSAKARFRYGLKETTVVWQRKHNGTAATEPLKGKTIDDLPPAWGKLAKTHPPGIRSQVTMFAKIVGDLFLQLLKMVTVPLIMTSLITGITGLGSQERFGRMFGKTLAYYVSTSLLAIVVGLILVNIIQPGVDADLPGGGQALESAEQTLPEMMYQQVKRLIPANPFSAIANGEFLSIISFAIVLGVFINLVGGEHGKRLASFFESAFAVMMKMTAWVISLAPIGVACFMIYATSTQGLSVFATLAWYMLTVFLALLVHATIVLPILVKTLGKRSPVEFARSMSPALLTAFSTASSNATLPLTINCVEQRAGVSNRTSSFVLPLGATINMDGTALYEVVAVLFIAQATGMELTIAEQLLVAVTALVASVGAAGIPHAGLVMMAIVLQAVGLPLEAQGMIIAVDRVLDMCRTSVNVWSDSCGCAIVDGAASGNE